MITEISVKLGFFEIFGATIGNVHTSCVGDWQDQKSKVGPCSLPKPPIQRHSSSLELPQVRSPGTKKVFCWKN